MTYLSCLKLHNDMSTKLKKMQKNDFEKDFFKLVNNAFFEKTRKYEKTQRYQTVATETRRNYLVLEPNYHTTIFFSENLLAIEKLLFYG